MNNRQTNRRRGRGNNRTQNNNRNGYDHQNRIDNRARGNAAQMLEKYKKLAQDAQHNGDRVNAEYYLQFADHYFRVLADYRSRQEESRPQREWRDEAREGGEDRDWRDDERDLSDDGEEGDSAVDASDDDDDYRRAPRQDRSDRDDRDNREARGNRNERGNRNDRGDRGERNDRNDRGQRSRNNNRNRNEARDDHGVADAPVPDYSFLPPAIGAANDAESAPEQDEKPARKPRGRRPKAAEEDVVAAAE
jgi:hypothetical protein